MDPEEAEARRIEELRAKEEREIENMIVNKQVTHEDIDRLNYEQINKICDKLGETQFNPNEYFDSESDDEVLRRFKKDTPYKDDDDQSSDDKNMVIQKDNYSISSKVPKSSQNDLPQQPERTNSSFNDREVP